MTHIVILFQGGGTNGVVEISLWLVRVLCNVSLALWHICFSICISDLVMWWNFDFADNDDYKTKWDVKVDAWQWKWCERMRLNPTNCCLRFRLPVTTTFKLTFASISLYEGDWGFNHTFDFYRLKIGDINITMTNHLKLIDDGCCLRNWRQAITDTIDCCVELCKSVSCTLPAQKYPEVHM